MFWPALLSHMWFVSPNTKLICLWQGQGWERATDQSLNRHLPPAKGKNSSSLKGEKRSKEPNVLTEKPSPWEGRGRVLSSYHKKKMKVNTHLEKVKS